MVESPFISIEGSPQGSENQEESYVDEEESFDQYEKVLFFIDELKQIQLIHLTDDIFTKDIN